MRTILDVAGSIFGGLYCMGLAMIAIWFNAMGNMGMKAALANAIAYASMVAMFFGLLKYGDPGVLAAILYIAGLAASVFVLILVIDHIRWLRKVSA